MADIPIVSPGDWIRVGKDTLHSFNAVVCHVYDELSPDGGHIEAVYLDYRKRAMNIDVKWTGTHWEPARESPYGGYADRYPRLQYYVGILRAGRKWAD
jgi:hypothetical protein